MLSRFWTFIISVAFWVFPYSKFVNAASLTSLFKHIRGVEEPSTEPSTDDVIREKVINFVRDKVFPIKAELLKPQEEMERHITDLIKTSLDDVTGVEFRMFMDFLKSLSLFGEKCPHERIKELIGVVEEQAELELEFKVADADHNDRLISCLHMALPIVVRGASSSNFMNFINKKIIPVFDQLPGERKVDLLRSLAEFSPFTTPQDSRQMLPSIVQLLKKYMTWKKTGEEMNFTYVECLLYTFHHLAHKVPNATNSLCGYKIVTGQPSDRLGEDFSEQYNDFTERLVQLVRSWLMLRKGVGSTPVVGVRTSLVGDMLKNVEEFTRATIKKLTQGMSENNKSLADAKTDEEKEKIKTKKQNATTGLRTCNNILTMTKPLHAKAPSFIGDKRINLSWKEATKTASTTTPAVGAKRPATAGNGSNNIALKKGRGSGAMQNQLVNRAIGGLSGAGRGGVSGGGRGRVSGGGRGGTRGRGWGGRGGRGSGRGRGRGYW
ncbi:apoptosis inhibitor 5-like protein [Trifolium pratense]|uniref:Apoptosis inhibitor 5-like protein n=1 Tax=Trifolium pratense TaxID=57577 RepID=A0A2K3NTA1_TRIPR|nr:apoptosis inhibitor 5-like protein [Trifolium pratense]